MRNPWHRLVSTYIQKIARLKGEPLKEEIKKLCLKSYDYKLDFKQFVRQCVIGQWKKNLYNIHWLPTTERCDLCNGHYDYIVAVENMSEESNYVLEQAGLKNPVEVFNNTREDTIRKNEKAQLSSDYQSYYRDMNSSDIQALRSLYSFEIYVLQYPDTPFVDFKAS